SRARATNDQRNRLVAGQGCYSRHKFQCLRRRDFVAVTVRGLQIANRQSKIGNLFAGVVQWQNGSFPSCTRGFDSPHPLFYLFPSKRYFKRWIVPKLIALRPIFWIRLTREWPNPC